VRQHKNVYKERHYCDERVLFLVCAKNVSCIINFTMPPGVITVLADKLEMTPFVFFLVNNNNNKWLIYNVQS
jgi:hypothetical protein